MPRLAFNYFIALWLYTDSFTNSWIYYSQLYSSSFYGTSLLGLKAEDIERSFDKSARIFFLKKISNFTPNNI